jgi:hypothetical protein
MTDNMTNTNKYMRLKETNTDLVLKAAMQSIRRCKADNSLLSASSDAGFIIPNGQKKGHRKGWQVFVTLRTFDEALLMQCPQSGGLIEPNET